MTDNNLHNAALLLASSAAMSLVFKHTEPYWGLSSQDQAGLQHIILTHADRHLGYQHTPLQIEQLRAVGHMVNNPSNLSDFIQNQMGTIITPQNNQARPPSGRPPSGSRQALPPPPPYKP